MKITSRFSGFSQHLILLSDTGDEHKPKICQSAHLKGWDDVVEGALQRNSQVTGQSEAPRRPFTHFTATFRRLNLLRLTGRKMFVRQRKTRCVWVFGASFCHSSLFHKSWFLWKVEISKSFRPGDVVLAKVVSFTCCSVWKSTCGEK